MLARMGRVLGLAPEEPKGEKQGDLRALVAARRALVRLLVLANVLVTQDRPWEPRQA